MKKILALLLTIFIVMMLFTSCSDAAMGENYDGGSYKSDTGYTNSPSSKDEISENTPAEDAELERKIIKTYRIRMETLRYNEAVALIASMTEEFGGYVASSSQEGGGTGSGAARSASYTLRIPAAKAEDFIARLSENGNVLSSSLNTEDVTDSYYGYEARLNSLVVQEERLMAMLDQATYLDEMLQIEDKLSSVRAEINGIHSKLQLMDKSVDYSYVYLTLNEVKEYQEPEKETYLERVGVSFVDAFASFAEVVGDLFIVFIWLLPYFLVGAVIVVCLIFVMKFDKKRKQKKSEPKIEKDDET